MRFSFASLLDDSVNTVKRFQNFRFITGENLVLLKVSKIKFAINMDQ